MSMVLGVGSDKQELRRQIRDIRKKADPRQVFSQSVVVCSVVESLEVFQKSKIVFAYWALPGEVQAELLIQKWSGAKRFYLPVVKGDALEFRLFESTKDLKTDNPLGIAEPTGIPWNESDGVDLILVPGVAFTEKGDRLGRGGGYYDRLLQQHLSAYKMGLAFGYQMVNHLPTEPHDVPMDGVVFG